MHLSKLINGSLRVKVGYSFRLKIKVHSFLYQLMFSIENEKILLFWVSII